jgi:glutaminyl-peptide cyclotransferase
MRTISGLGDRLRARWLEVLLLFGLAGLLAWFASLTYGFVPKPPPTPTPLPRRFSGEIAYRHVLAQTELGARPTGSDANLKTGDYIAEQLKEAGWQVELQPFTYRDTPARNIIGKAGKGPVVLIGAHYDTRRVADNDPDPARRSEPVIGGNDGASGVAVLLELARALDKERLTNEVWLVFFDAEDNGRLNGWDFSAGSTYMAENLTVMPEEVIIADMIGDADQQIYKERNSSPALQDKIWQIAASLGYGDYFIPEYKWSMLDDHTPFLQLGIPAVDIIDFDYPYWHTTQDTADKVSRASLERVGRVLETLLEGGQETTRAQPGHAAHERGLAS